MQIRNPNKNQKQNRKKKTASPGVNWSDDDDAMVMQ